MADLHITNRELLNYISTDVCNECFKSLELIFGDTYSSILPKDKEHIREFEMLMYLYLLSALKNINSFPGFEKHIAEYKNNYETTSFVTLFSDVLAGFGFKLILEPDIKDHSKKPDILALKGNKRVFFECKNPINPDPNRLIVENREIFEALKNHITSEYSYAVFYKRRLTEDELEKLSYQFVTSINDIVQKENDVIIDDINMGIKVVVSGEPDSIYDKSRIELFGVPIFSTGYCNANGINDYGKNIMFYKEASHNTIFDQLKKSKGKVPVGTPYIVAINISSDRFDVEEYKVKLKDKFLKNDNTRISGLVLVEFGFTELAEVIVKMNWVPNPNAEVSVGDMSCFFERTISRNIVQT